MIVAELRREPADLESLLEAYFAEASERCGRITREQARAALAGAWVGGHGAVFGAGNGSSGSAGLLLAEERAWEASFFGCRVTQLTLLVARGGAREREAAAAALLEAWSGTQDREQTYAVTRIAAGDAPAAHALERAGFRLLVPMVSLDHPLGPAPGAQVPAGVAVGDAVADDVPGVGEIARTAFPLGRFAVEPGLPPHVAGEMHATWARNCGNGSLADAVLVARDAGGLAGFIALRRREYGGEAMGEINLIAVAEHARGAGIGQALVRAGLDWARSRDVRGMVVRTELPNAASIRMYERCGFRVGEGSLYYRRWKTRRDRR